MQVHPCIFQPGNFTGWGSEGVNDVVTSESGIIDLSNSLEWAGSVLFCFLTTHCSVVCLFKNKKQNKTKNKRKRMHPTVLTISLTHSSTKKKKIRFFKIKIIRYYYYYYYCSLLYSVILRSRADSLRSHVILHE